MSGTGSEWVMAHPSLMEPDIVVQQNQKSDFIRAMGGGAPRVKLGKEDKFVYLKSLAVRTKVSSGASGANQVPSVSVGMDLANAAAYLQQVRAEYNHHQTAMFNKWGIPLPEAQRLGMRQGHYQQLRNKFLYGEHPAYGEGMLNAAGIVTTTLPADINGATTISTYDNGAMALFLLGIIVAMKTRTYQLGKPQRFVVLGPQQDIGLWEYQGIVQLTSYQRPGGGTATIAGLVKKILEENGDMIEFCYDDTLIGQGAGGTDAILFIMPELEKTEGSGWNTNEFAKITPNMRDCVVQYADMAAPMEIATPLPGGAIDILSEMTATSGWVVRAEVVTLLSATH